MVVNERYQIILVLKDHGADFNLKPWLEDLQYEETGNDEISNAKAGKLAFRLRQDINKQSDTTNIQQESMI